MAARRGRGKSELSVLNSSAGVIDLQPPRGTRDFFPHEMRLQQWLYERFRHVSLAFGFEEVGAPVLENESLFTRKAGEEITQQLYNFEDKGGRKMALRPELTPSLARMVLQKGKSLCLPIKWSSIGQCWRYERMTRGRRREHYQWNMDIVGIQGMEAEAELIAAVCCFFQMVGLSHKEVGIRISSRKVLQSILDRCGVPPELFSFVCIVVDKLDKISIQKVKEELVQLKISDEAIADILDALEVDSISSLAQLLGEESEVVMELRRLMDLLEAYQLLEWVQFDASVVRGLAYYTGTVFEGFDRAGKLRAICGGGRYDKLLSTFGGEDLPMCGFGFGDAVIVELLRENNLLPQFPSEIQDVVYALERDSEGPAISIAMKLRSSGRKVDLVLEEKKMKWVFKHIERVGAQRLFLVGSDELKKGSVRVKDLATREERDIPIQSLN